MKRHLLYIDITTRCNVGCDHCMYNAKDASQIDLELDRRARSSLSALINADDIDVVTISGEGEPFSYFEGVKRVLSLSHGGRDIHILTKGLKVREEHLRELERIAHERGDSYVIRLSMDRGHAEKIPFHHYRSLFRMMRSSCLGFAVRSVFEDRHLVRDTIGELLDGDCVPFVFESPNPLDDKFITRSDVIAVTYKAFVHPHKVGVIPELDMWGYVREIEKTCNRPFTLGHLRAVGAQPGLDITVKPTGDVVFYGAEFRSFGDIHNDQPSIESLLAARETHPWLKALYRRPFLDCITSLCGDPEVERLVREVNNPYWVIRELNAECPSALQKWLT